VRSEEGQELGVQHATPANSRTLIQQRTQDK
jgi:hypothetical protein